MKSLKGVVVITTVIAVAAMLGACQKDINEPPLKFGAGDVSVEKTAR